MKWIKLTTMRILVAMAFLFLSSPVRAICGDCDLDGSVTINELVQAVTNALDQPNTETPVAFSTPTVTPSPGPDRCGTAQPGQRIKAAGHDFVVVEVPLFLDGSSRRYSVRYPVALDDEGAIVQIGLSFRLNRRPCSGDLECFSPLEPGGICGFKAVSGLYTYGIGTGTYREVTISGVKHAGVTYVEQIIAQAQIVIDEDYEPLYIDIAQYFTVGFDVTPIPTTYNFTNPQYPVSGLDSEANKQAMKDLLNYISVH